MTGLIFQKISSVLNIFAILKKMRYNGKIAGAEGEAIFAGLSDEDKAILVRARSAGRAEGEALEKVW